MERNLCIFSPFLYVFSYFFFLHQRSHSKHISLVSCFYQSFFMARVRGGMDMPSFMQPTLGVGVLIFCGCKSANNLWWCWFRLWRCSLYRGICHVFSSYLFDFLCSIVWPICGLSLYMVSGLRPLLPFSKWQSVVSTSLIKKSTFSPSEKERQSRPWL